MASRKRTSTRRRPRQTTRFVWGIIQLLLVVVGILAVAVYVSRVVPLVPEQDQPEKVASPSTSRRVQHARTAEPHESQKQSVPAASQREMVQNPQSLPSQSNSDRATPSLARLKVSSREVDAGNPSAKLVALTFDAGSSAEPVPTILRALAQRGVKCTFFLTGQWMERHPDMARHIADAGHELGNHSWSHPAFTSLSDEQIREQLRRTEEIALRVCGRSTKPLFRPPFGARDQRVRSVVAEEGYLTIYWTVDSWDSVKRDITPQMITDRVMRQVRPGAIVLMHCGSAATAQALPQLLNALDAEGYRVVTVSELLLSSDGEP
jgi:peptidoglycan/xylan/chitin deacetylase (PgdA/CDA1 family)